MKLKPQKVFYGWYIVASGLVITVLQGGLYVYGFGAFYTPFLNSFGATRAQIAGVLSLTRLEGGLIAPVAGFLIDKYGPRRLMLFGLSMMGLGFVLLSRANSLLMLYGVFVVMATGSSFGSARPVQVALANWFIRRRGRVMGLLMTGFGIGGSLVFVVAWLIDTFGWRTAAVISGVTIWVVGLPLSLVVRHKPEDMGLLPDDEQPNSSDLDQSEELNGTKENIPDTGVDLEENFTARQALKTRAFWMLVLVYGAWSILPPTLSVHQFAFLQEEVGISYSEAGLWVSAFSFVSLFGRVSVGWISDYINPRYLLAILYVLMGVGMLLMSTVHSNWQILLYILVMAPAYGGSIPLRP
ncbi:MFS transporter, partial [Dehalococcoidia bacterium]|nr:MFS transporter [Dehalococcoidia bacterium]